MLVRHPLAAAVLGLSLIAAGAQAQTSTDVVVMRKAIAPPKQVVRGTWTVAPATTAMWSDCSNGNMTTSHVVATCSGGNCDPATKPTKFTQTCTAKRNCNVNWANRAAMLGCERTGYKNGYFDTSSAAAFCSAFSDAVGCTTISNTQVSVCLKSGTYTPGWATNTLASTCQ